MTILSPSNLETTDYGQQGWNAVHTANMERLNAYLVKLWGPFAATKALGADSVSSAAAETAQALTNNTTGTASQIIAAITQATVDDYSWMGVLNNNFASLIDEINKLRDDNAQLRATVNSLLAALRKTSGCGVLNG